MIGIVIAAALALSACQQQPALPDQAKASAEYMAKVVKEPGVKVLPSGVAFKIVRSGPADGMRPALQDEVKVHYEGKLIDGKVFDSSIKAGEPRSFRVNQVVPGWTEALTRMKVGDILPIDLLPVVPVHVEQMPLFSGEFGVHNGRNAIKVTQVHAARPASTFDTTTVTP